uniref:Ycf63 n=1 Tax=Gracilaria firma TaxID=2510791 RepID=A0A2Z2JLL5_9FLOR|nr:Ycf63 [Gracilaria changii]ART65162.1 Ycf63 [Gracilaria changii]
MFNDIKSCLCNAINSRLKCKLHNSSYFNILEQMKIVGPDSLNIVIVTAFFIGMVFTIQIVKEFLYINALSLIGSILTISFIRELSPVLTSVIIVGRIASYFTAELATMNVTEQLNALYMLEVNPLSYLVFPRVIACIIMLPCLNILSFITSLFSSSFICFTIYNIHPEIFFISSLSALCIQDIFKSLLKTVIFGCLISVISCFWGLVARGGAKGVGCSTTVSVVTSLLSVFIFDFLLSYIMFNKLGSSVKVL